MIIVESAEIFKHEGFGTEDMAVEERASWRGVRHEVLSTDPF